MKFVNQYAEKLINFRRKTKAAGVRKREKIVKRLTGRDVSHTENVVKKVKYWIM